ncbi:hypothetical protein [Bacillus cereus]|uniref:hypothetical protein n=1 Tax=Bacillus cereus TaxID=1396 RepID=UPI001F3858B8|nr:hypothetical protein [Bacillus cereus]
MKPQIIGHVYSGFAGMDDEYKALIAEHHKIKSQLGVYTQEYINEHSLKTVVAIASLRGKYADKVNGLLDKLEDLYSVKKDVKAEPRDTNERLLYELQRSNDMRIFDLKLRTNDPLELMALYDEYSSNEDFLVMLDARMHDVAPVTKSRLEAHIVASKRNEFLEVIDLERRTITTLAKADSYPSNAVNGDAAIKFRSLSADLSNPILAGKEWVS